MTFMPSTGLIKRYCKEKAVQLLTIECQPFVVNNPLSVFWDITPYVLACIHIPLYSTSNPRTGVFISTIVRTSCLALRTDFVTM